MGDITRSALFVPQFPRLRYLLSGWGVLFACICATIGLANARDDAGTAAVMAVFSVFGLWAAWRWWRLGVAIDRQSVIFREVFRSRVLPREAVQSVSAAARTTPWWKRVLLGDWLLTHELVLHPADGGRPGRVSLEFASQEAAASFAAEVNAALAESARSGG